jgi:hypothetical protein
VRPWKGNRAIAAGHLPVEQDQIRTFGLKPQVGFFVRLRIADAEAERLEYEPGVFADDRRVVDDKAVLHAIFARRWMK